MFVLRAVCGTHKGEYYSGFNSEKMAPTWVDSVEAAEKVSGPDAAGIVMAMIDGPRFVVVPERLADSQDAECDEFADRAARGMFQNPSDAIKTMIRSVIRDSVENPFFEAPAEMPATGDYMSVWEWLTRAMAARNQM